MAKRPTVPSAIMRELRAITRDLPEVAEEPAWVGTRWVIRKKNFAHVLNIADGWPPAYAKAAGTDGPAIVLTFRSSGAELNALANAGHPFFRPVWFDDIIGVVIDTETDWSEIRELVIESYCALAPKKLVALVARPA
ncbi:MAG: MmcQ/YjbR family DNA-binding protein [Ilumatobacteraceae bacterium]